MHNELFCSGIVIAVVWRQPTPQVELILPRGPFSWETQGDVMNYFFGIFYFDEPRKFDCEPHKDGNLAYL
jgi:hypothetical protein